MFIVIGNTTDVDNFYLNLQSTFLWTMASTFKYKNDNSLRFIKNDVITLENYPANVTLYEGTIRFNNTNTTIHNFPFYQTPDLFYLEFDSIPLAHYFKNESFSIVNKLYVDGIISHKSFGFVFQALNITNDKEIESSRKVCSPTIFGKSALVALTTRMSTFRGRLSPSTSKVCS